MKFGESNFNKIENLTSKKEYVFDIDNYNLQDEEFQNYLDKLKEENSSLYNEILNSIAEKEYDNYYNNENKESNNTEIKETSILETNKEDEEEEEDRDLPGYDLFGKYKKFESKSKPTEQKVDKSKFNKFKKYIHPFDLYK